MKTMSLLALLMSCATLSHAQTTPATSSSAATTGSSSSVAGTKNVGTDRADAPKAPGMSATPTTPTGQMGRSRATDRRAARKATTGKTSQ